MQNKSEQNVAWWQAAPPEIDASITDAALQRQSTLTKPAGSLGKLEEIAVKFAGWQGKILPQLERVGICVFAADHGIAETGVSAFPQAVTAEMIRNFARGGAAISVIAKKLNAEFAVVNLGTCSALEPLEGVVDQRIDAGTASFINAPAMTEEQVASALSLGGARANDQYQLAIGGEMGIGNTTSAAACAAALLGLSTEATVGRGTGVDDDTLRHKRYTVDLALEQHASYLKDPMQILRCLGGFEIAGLAGYYIASAQKGVPSLVDGYISSVAALIACRLNPKVRHWLLFAHRSVEPGHQHVLAGLEAEPLLDLQMRLGEGSGAAVAVDLIQSALQLHSEMATFNEAGVSGSL